MWKKDEMFSKSVEFKELVEKETNKKVKSLESNNGCEYVSNEFRNLCVKEDIQQDLKTPHNPDQNRVVERKNCSILGAMRVTLHDKGLPLHLLVEACNTTFGL